jgi:aminoglycoside/choline kinase family phosphotransferase
MNRAGVAHMDFRSRNIMWKREGQFSSVSLKIIDFEDSLAFGRTFRIPRYLAYDTRYPFYATTEEFVTISERHNEWFRIALIDWARDDSVSMSFDDFICQESEQFLERING